MHIDIGRRTIFGNPYRARRGEELQGRTLADYEVYLAARRRDEEWAIELARSAGIPDVPAGRTFEQELVRLGDHLYVRGGSFWCPGCKGLSGRKGICHGFALASAALDAITPKQPPPDLAADTF